MDSLSLVPKLPSKRTIQAVEYTAHRHNGDHVTLTITLPPRIVHTLIKYASQSKAMRQYIDDNAGNPNHPHPHQAAEAFVAVTLGGVLRQAQELYNSILDRASGRSSTISETPGQS